MSSINILVITDHTSHTKHDSFYMLFDEIKKHPNCKQLAFVSRGNKHNKDFFNCSSMNNVHGEFLIGKIEASVSTEWYKTTEILKLSEFDVIFLRLDYPINNDFLKCLEKEFNGLLINRPSGIINTGTKEYLLYFPQITPFIKIAKTINEVKKLANKSEIVIKPIRSYGGKGIVRIGEHTFYSGDEKVSQADAYTQIEKELSINKKVIVNEFLSRVSEGDNRVIVINGTIIGSFTRTPSKSGWLCNLNQGGVIKKSVLSEEEILIAKETSEKLQKEGILIFGFDTLVSNDGKRVLTELNTSNVGGFIQIQELTGINIFKQTSNEIFSYINSSLTNKVISREAAI